MKTEKVMDYKQNNRYHFNVSYMKNARQVGDFKLFQVGELYCNGDTVVGMHVHPNLFELTVAKQGRGIITTNRASVPIESGDIYLSFPGDMHQIESSAEKPLGYLFLAFQTDDANFSEALKRIVQRCIFAEMRVIRNRRISDLVEALLAELNSEQVYSDALMNAILQQIMIYLIREFSETGGKTRSLFASDAEFLCYRIMNDIDVHLFSMDGLSGVAERLNYNYSYLSKLFRRVTHTTIREYYQDRRLESARLLIEENKLKITQIAEMLHYSSVQTFSRSFKDKYFVAPKEHQLEHARKKMASVG